MTSERRRSAPASLEEEPDEIPPEIEENLHGFALAAGGANVIMQLARLPIGHGVAKSTVDSGRVDKHPIKRLRTTAAYLVIASLGTKDERLALRREIDRVHAQVRSAPSDTVQYDAFDPELQLWVAACLYKGFEDILELTDGRLDDDLVDNVVYPHGRRFATTLQVPPEMWPEDRAAFEEYWRRGVAAIEMDDLTRQYLVDLADRRFLADKAGPLGALLRPWLRRSGRFTTLGFLPEEFRRELGLPYDERMLERHRRLYRAVGRISKRLPRPLRQFPLNLYLWDTRRRLARGRPVI